MSLDPPPSAVDNNEQQAAFQTVLRQVTNIHILHSCMNEIKCSETCTLHAYVTPSQCTGSSTSIKYHTVSLTTPTTYQPSTHFSVIQHQCNSRIFDSCTSISKRTFTTQFPLDVENQPWWLGELRLADCWKLGPMRSACLWLEDRSILSCWERKKQGRKKGQRILLKKWGGLKIYHAHIFRNEKSCQILNKKTF